MKIAVIQGPNLDRLGRRKPERYGTRTLDDVTAEIDKAADELGVEAVHVQSNHEGALIDWFRTVQDEVAGVIVNPAGLTTYGKSLYDTLSDADLPVAVVHMSAYFKYDSVDLFADLADVYLCGLKSHGYVVALQELVSR
ncbi:type II 3-dehydroquinate dehydratase [Prauserella cavernicola]|uniref:3-dehydroquinate dehydratase n=1 Tax=Prauserella cavernicola TaxID=2800127 RepID=A0A934V9B7_9PSEU|nr:type II 3-dehydroquinate dehydratase [Prauserella cavernicola]MBK1789175.1 type II 3-dehydroquinate dehydratase [Prauserella cavernicola]